MITGGTGSFGQQLVRRLPPLQPKRIIIFSRDEKKQGDMAYRYADAGLEFVIGDVRDSNRVNEAMKGVDIVYHAAALKQVPNCERNPLEAVKTNILGAENVRAAAIRNKVRCVVAISTDKAVKPINVMGMTKAIQERVMLENSRSHDNPRFSVVRYGNVLGSRGSVVPFFCRMIREDKPLPITHPDMTRFLLTLDEAVDLVFRATLSGDGNRLFVKKSPATRVLRLAKAVGKLLADDENYPTTFVGIRPGEKIHETLVSEDEMRRATEEKRYLVIHPYGSKHPEPKDAPFEYTSDNTRQLDLAEITEVLSSSGILEGYDASEETQLRRDGSREVASQES